MEQKGRILGDTANLESATKEDITATLRHHESLPKSTNVGAPGVARDAIASRFEIVKQAINAKEPFRVHFVRVQAALTRAEEAEEKKRSAVLQDELIAGGGQQLQQQGCARVSNSREETFLFSVERVGVRAPQIASDLAACAELSVPLKEVTWSLLEEMTRNPVDLGIKTGEGAVASWSFVAVLMCCHEAVCVIWLCVWAGCADPTPSIWEAPN